MDVVFLDSDYKDQFNAEDLQAEISPGDAEDHLDHPKKTIFVISGLSGSGKGTLLEKVGEKLPITISRSYTTRKRRGGEREDAYFFTDETTFHEMEKGGKFLETNYYARHYYGTPLSELDRLLSIDNVIRVIEIDVNGYQNLLHYDYGYDLVSVFILPPSVDDLVKRLHDRGTESLPSMIRRLRHAIIEVQSIDDYDHVIINDDENAAVRELKDILGQTGSTHPRKSIDKALWIKTLKQAVRDLGEQV